MSMIVKASLLVIRYVVRVFLLIYVLFFFAAWQKVMKGQFGCGLLMCVDGICPFDDGSSVLIGEWCNYSLPPQERYKSKNMLLSMYIPEKFSSSHQKKFFDYIIDQELRPLHHTGIDGMAIRVFGFCLDLKGRDKFLQQKGCNSYFGCSVCHNQSAPGIFKKVTHTGARLWLPSDHPLRNVRHGDYQFVSSERRPPPPLRTTSTVREAIALVNEGNLVHFMGECITCLHVIFFVGVCV